MLALFAVGVVTGTILSFELGLLWPAWMQDFGNVFGLGFTHSLEAHEPSYVTARSGPGRDRAGFRR